MLNIMPQGDNILDVDLTKPENCIFIPVNCKGIMGAGLALDFKKMYPTLAELYTHFCKSGNMYTGDPSIVSNIFNDTISQSGCGSVVLFPTKNDWWNLSQLNWIRDGLLRLACEPYHARWRKQTHNIHIPKLGCGLGSLGWADVRPLIVRFADMMPEHEIYLYE